MPRDAQLLGHPCHRRGRIAGKDLHRQALRLQRGTSDLLQLQRWNAGASTTLRSTSVPPLAAGSWVALLADATGVEAFRSTDGTTWVSIGSSTDTTLTGPLTGGVETLNAQTRIDNVAYGAPASG